MYSDQGKYKEAAGLLTEALSIREDILGTDHPAVRYLSSTTYSRTLCLIATLGSFCSEMASADIDNETVTTAGYFVYVKPLLEWVSEYTVRTYFTRWGGQFPGKTMGFFFWESHGIFL